MLPMRRWISPYNQDDPRALRYVVAGVMSFPALFALCGFGVGEAPVEGMVAGAGTIVLWEVAIWRIALVGVSVSDFGVKVRTVFWTHVIPWSRVVRAWAGPAAHFDAWQIWISVRDPERDIETPLWRKGSRARHRNRIVLPPKAFAATLKALDPQRSSFNRSRARTDG
jgi:hypothetical protein